MKRVAFGSLVALVLAPAVWVAFASGTIPGTRGCDFRSVDRDEYVARNEALFETIPLPARVARAHANTWIHGIPSENKCFPFGPNGPPYESYVTTRVYLEEPGGLPIGFDRRVVRGSWVEEPNSPPHGINFRRGEASLVVSLNEDGFTLGVDHGRYAGR